MKTVEYAKAFNFTMRDGSTRFVPSGKQEVPDEIADSTYAQHHQVEVPEELTKGMIPVYGKVGHEVAAFENRDLGPDLDDDDTVGQEEDGEVEQPDGKGLSARVEGRRGRRTMPST